MVSFFSDAGSALLGACDDALELFLPRTCATCRAYGRVMRGRGALCPVCERLLALSTVNLGLARAPYFSLPCVTAGLYEYELARALLAFKNGGRTDLLPLLSSALGRAVLELVEQTAVAQGPGRPARLVLVPLPSSRASARRRGFEPAMELARTLPRLLAGRGLEVVCFPSLAYRAWSAGGASQKALGRVERGRRMQGALALGRLPGYWLGRRLDVEGQVCLLCDDVVTTGASMAEGTRVLVEAGARVVGGAAVARVPLDGAGLAGNIL